MSNPTYNGFHRIKIRNHGFIYKCCLCYSEDVIEEHNKSLCVVCKEWEDCKNDCKLTKLTCNDCGNIMNIS
jgi:hypothetical protein